MPLNDMTVGRVLAIAVKTAHRGVMREVETATAVVDGCFTQGVSPRARRGITFLSRQQWQQVTAELGAELPWHSRRANVLIDADTLAPWIGRRIAIGDIRVRIHKETEPCRLMDEIHPGLWRCLIPDCRGGVYGQVEQPGTLRIGDTVTFANDD